MPGLLKSQINTHQSLFTLQVTARRPGAIDKHLLRRWCLHILPKGFTKSRRYGGWSNHHRHRYTKQCQELLGAKVTSSAIELSSAIEPSSTEPSNIDEPPRPRCPTCGGELELLERVFRTSWRDIFASDSPDRPRWYQSSSVVSTEFVTAETAELQKNVKTSTRHRSRESIP